MGDGQVTPFPIHGWNPNEGRQSGSVRPIDPAMLCRIYDERQPEPAVTIGALIVASLVGWTVLGMVAAFAYWIAS